MTNHEVKLKVKHYIKEFDIRTTSSSELRKAIEKQGYTVVEYNHIFNDEPVASLLKALQLSDRITRSRGFTYADHNHRIVFIHEDLSEAERSVVFAHESGHIYCGHMTSSSIIGKDVQEEYEANEFAHYLINQAVSVRVTTFVRTHRRKVVISSLGILAVVAGLTAFLLTNKQKSYYGDFYVTDSGDKYHKAACIFIKDKTNVHHITLDEFDSGEFEPCGICLP